MQPKNIPALTGLRFFAAVSVLFWHAQGTFFSPTAFYPFQGDGAVQLFFVLSGFVLTVSGNDKKRYSDFIIGRIARIWPTHLAALAFLIAIFLPFNSLDWIRDHQVWTALDLLLLQAWVPHIATIFSFNGVAWSLSAEMFFYLVFPVCVVALRRSPLVKALLFFCATALATYLVSRQWPALNGLWVGYVNPITGLCSFVLGVAAALYAQQSPAPSPDTLSKATMFEVAAVVLALTSNICFRLLTPYHLNSASGFANFAATSAAAPAYAALIFALARYRGALGRFLSTRAMVLLGESSFALYMFHQIIIQWRDVHTKLLMPSHVEQFMLFLVIVTPLLIPREAAHPFRNIVAPRFREMVAY